MYNKRYKTVALEIKDSTREAKRRQARISQSTISRTFDLGELQQVYLEF